VYRNSGLGKETVLQLAKHRPRKIFLAARNESKSKNAIKYIEAELVEEVDIEYLPLDLASLTSVKNAADKFKNHSTRLDILVLNAGVMAMPPETTHAGFEIHMGTNHVGHHLLTQLLLPILLKTATESESDVRVVTVSSEAYYFSPALDTLISTSKLRETSPFLRYAASKAANILFAAELARRHPELTSVSVHPGIIMTDLHNRGQRSGVFVLQTLKIAAPLISQDVQHGALTQLWAAAGAKKGDLVNGGYYSVEKLRPWNPWARNELAGKTLWDWTEEGLERAGF
jgi:NAD(P)-dependent dehydrogenase (short-subunit alcohol dehydrogenase family)